VAQDRGEQTQLVFSELLGRRVRAGSWDDQKISTYHKIREALVAERWDTAAALANYFVDEANVCYSLYRQWIPDLNNYLRAHEVAPGDLDAINARITALLTLPDGRPWHAQRQWDSLLDAVQRFVGLAHRERADEALAQLDQFKETWRQCHDRDVDHIYGLMSEIKERFGEDAVGDALNVLLGPWFATRYERFDVDKHPWPEALDMLVTLTFEAMRGHLVGPERTGDIEFVETEDRVIVRFDPCGSGGRTVRGDWVEETPPRMEPPYGWRVSEEERSWNHYTKGVCLYCSHCIVLTEEMPIAHFGYPVRVVDPPVYPDTDRDPAVRQKCQWQMFKDPTAVPEEYYRRVGRTKPAAFGSQANGKAPGEHGDETPDRSPGRSGDSAG